MFTISKRFSFSASHQLGDLPPEHPCGRLHGHNYEVEVELAGEDLDQTGFVLDYGALGPVRAFLDATLDHRHLNDVLQQPTAELLARWLFQHARQLLPDGAPLSGVGVSETPKTWAWYRP